MEVLPRCTADHVVGNGGRIRSRAEPDECRPGLPGRAETEYPRGQRPVAHRTINHCPTFAEKPSTPRWRSICRRQWVTWCRRGGVQNDHQVRRREPQTTSVGWRFNCASLVPRRGIARFGLYLQGFARVGLHATASGGSRRDRRLGRQRRFSGLQALSWAPAGRDQQRAFNSQRARLIDLGDFGPFWGLFSIKRV